MNKTMIGYLFALTLYGTIGLFLRFINYSSEFVVLCRGTLGSLFIMAAFIYKKHHINFKSIRKNLFLLVCSGICLGLNWIFLFEGYKYSLAIASLCNYIAPITVVAISAIFLKEKLNIKQFICIVMAFVGMLMVTGVFERFENVSSEAVIYGLLAAIGFIAMVLINKRLKDIESLEKTLIQLLSSVLVVLPYVIVKDSFPEVFDLRSTILVIILGFLHTGVAYICYFNAIGKLPSRTIAILGYLEPALNVLFGTIFLNESMSALSLLGAFLIILASIGNEVFTSK